MDQQPTGLERILAERGREGADADDGDDTSCKLVIFDLGGEWFAIPGPNVREILPLGPVYFVPGCPPSLDGVINVRGDIESVINLYALLGKPPPQESRDGTILLGRAAAMRSGIRVGRVVDVLDVRASAIQPPHGVLPEHMRRIVSGFMTHQGSAVVVLDLERIFDDYRLALP